MKHYLRKHGQGLAQSLRRPPVAPPSGDRHLIIVEGEVTERVYFRRIRARLELSGAQFEIVPHGSNNPVDLVDKAIAEADRRKKASLRRDTQTATTAYNKLWIVFDTDVVAPATLTQGLAYAAHKGVLVASSTPSFEYWLALHLSPAAPLITTSGQAETHLNDLIRPHGKRYTKRQAEPAAEALMPWFTPLAGTAVRHADLVRRNRTPGANTACSDVDRLFRELNAAAPHHLRYDFTSPAPQPGVVQHRR